MHEYTTEEMHELDTIETRLILALEIARSNYSLKEKEIQAKNIENIRGIIQDVLDKIPKPK